VRYFRIVITNPQTGAVVVPSSLASIDPTSSYTSFVNGKTLPGALNVEFDIPVTVYAVPFGEAFVRIWGVSLAEISQANDLNNLNIAVYGGFQKGLPLADPSQAGLLVQGYIYQALGNWIGNSMTLDLYIRPGNSATDSTPTKPKNITLNWKKGTPLSGALQQTLSAAYPGFTSTINISSKVVATEDQIGYYSGMEQLGAYVKAMSKQIVGGSYQGVDILLTGTTFKVDDGTVQNTPKQIAFKDMIGQPTWLDSVTIQTKFAMRADIAVMDYLQFPPAITTQSGNANSPFVNPKATFQGTFQVKQIRHVGNYRQADGNSWVTVVDTYSTAPVAAQQAA